MASFSGIIHNGGVPNGPHIHLPLEELRVKVVIVDVSARVTMYQVYKNISGYSTSRAVYCFPTPDTAAVCAFEMQTEEGRVVVGKCKEKSKAKEEYEDAVSKGTFAGMLEWVTDDIFTISVGCIPAGETVTIKLTFVLNLMNDDNPDEIRLQLPMHIGQRYGTPPTALLDASSPNDQTRIRITTDIQTSGSIINIRSPSHAGEITQQMYRTHTGRASRKRSTVKFKAKNFLERDFVLVVHADALDEARCFAELEPRPSSARSDETATLSLQLTFVPKLPLPPIPSQEYLFVVDRSGSMHGERIETAKKTLQMLLRMLPTGNTHFNIYSFGDFCDSMWPSASVQYDQNTLDHATSSVDHMSADYGGTEIRNALQSVLSGRRRSGPTAIFLLTDGESHNIDGTIALVRTGVAKAPSHAPIRVFTLGIGHGVSQAMCQGIAKAGNGECLFAITTESIVGKCARLLRAGRTPFIKDITIDWGIPAEHLSSSSPSVNFNAERISSRTIKLRPSPVIQQVPNVIHDIHASIRFVVFAIIKLRKLDVPKEVTLRGRVDGYSDGTERTIDMSVAVREVQLTKFGQEVPLIHTLAARYLIDEHRKGLATPPLAVVPTATEAERRRAAIIRLGERYQLMSEYTSFIAVDPNRQRESRAQRRSRNDFGNYREHLDDASESNVSIPATARWSWASAGIRDSVGSIFSGIFSGSQAHEATPIPGAWPDTPPRSRSPSPHYDDGYDSAASYSTMSSLAGCSCESEWSEWSDPPRAPLSEEDIRLQRCPSPPLLQESVAPQAVREARKRSRPQNIRQPVSAPPVKHEVTKVIRMQKFDGSFDLRDMHTIVEDHVIEECGRFGVDDKVVATVIAVAFMMKHMTDQKDLLNDLIGKANEYLELQRKDGQHLVKKVREILG